MAQSFFNQNFNLNDFKKNNEYLKHLYNPENRYQAAELYKENQLEENAKQAIQSDLFLGLTLREKLAEMGIGEMVATQIKDTAINMVTGVVSPMLDYLKNIEIVLDEKAYNEAFQSPAKQMYQANVAMSEDAQRGIFVNGLTNSRFEEDGKQVSTGTQFVYNM